MKKDNYMCDSMMVSRFCDQELDHEENIRIRQHIAGCAFCQNAIEENQTVSAFFKTAFDRKLSGMEPDLEKNVIDLIHRKKNLFHTRIMNQIRELFASGKFLIPAAAVAAMLLLFFSAPEQYPASSPSAIISSLTGDVSSLVIIETPMSRQTIIWFDETF